MVAVRRPPVARHLEANRHGAREWAAE